jgi:hypothetical protein
MRLAPLHDAPPLARINANVALNGLLQAPSPYRSSGIPTPPCTVEEDIHATSGEDNDAEDDSDLGSVDGLDALEEAAGAGRQRGSTAGDSDEDEIVVAAAIGSTGKRGPEVKFKGKRYPCTVAGCDKVYKNPGGLKYHLIHTHPDPEAGGSEIPAGLLGRNGKRGRNVPDVYKPYRCLVFSCGKRYKNLNGLVSFLSSRRF